MERVLRNLLKDGAFHGVPRERSKTMSSIRGRGNRTTELRLRALLIQAGIRGWRIHPRGLVGSPDFMFDLHCVRLVVFTDGCFWHGCPRCAHPMATRGHFWRAKLARNRARDRRAARALRAAGYVVLRIWEHQLSERPMLVVERIRRVLKKLGNRRPSATT